jgi:hypothetical protein
LQKETIFPPIFSISSSIHTKQGLKHWCYSSICNSFYCNMYAFEFCSHLCKHLGKKLYLNKKVCM